MSRTNLADYY